MTYRLPSLNTLRAFEAAARHLSFKLAARELGVTAGAISQQVKKLENSLGVLLFRRLANGLLLTPEGETYLPRVSGVFEELTEATEAIAPKINGKKFDVGVCADTQTVLAPNWPNHSDHLRPFIRDSIKTNDVQLVRNNEIDCLIRLGGGPYGDLQFIKIPVNREMYQTVEDLHFVCKPGLADCRQTRAILEDLQQQVASAPQHD